MNSGWFVKHDYTQPGHEFVVYRMLDAMDRSKGIEVYAGYPKHADALAKAKELNAREAETFWKRKK